MLRKITAGIFFIFINILLYRLIPVVTFRIRLFHGGNCKNSGVMHADPVNVGSDPAAKLLIGNYHIGNDNARDVEGLCRRGCQNQPVVYILCNGKGGLVLHPFCCQIPVDFIWKKNEVVLFTEIGCLRQFFSCPGTPGRVVGIAHDQHFRPLVHQAFHMVKIQFIPIPVPFQRAG